MSPLLTEAEYQELYQTQGGRCAICMKRSPRRKFDTDHDHTTGRIRGLLCRRCNRALGAFEYSMDVLLNLINYTDKIYRDRYTHHGGHSGNKPAA